MKIYAVYVLYHYGVFEWQDLVDLVKISEKYIVNEDLCSRCTILLWCIWMAGFFFFMGNTNKLCWILEASNTSCRRAWSRKLGLSSTQIEKSLMPSAYLANRWAGLLPCLFTWETSTLRNSLKADRELETMAATDEEGGVISFRALTNNKESPSRMKSCMSKSLANWMPTSNALA